MDSNLFTGKLVRLVAMNAEADADAFARWDRDSEYMRQLDSGPHLPDRARKSRKPSKKSRAKIQIPSCFPCAPWLTTEDRVCGLRRDQLAAWRYVCRNRNRRSGLSREWLWH